MSTLRERLQSRTKRGPTVDPVETPEWPEEDGKVFVRVNSAKAYDRWEEQSSGGNPRALWVAMFACDEAGNRLFCDEDAAWLGEEPFSVINRIFQTGQALNRRPAVLPPLPSAADGTTNANASAT